MSGSIWILHWGTMLWGLPVPALEWFGLLVLALGLFPTPV